MNRKERDAAAERIRVKMRARGEWVIGDPPIKKSSEELGKKKEKKERLAGLDTLLGGGLVKLKPEKPKDVPEEFDGGYSKGKQVGKDKK